MKNKSNRMKRAKATQAVDDVLSRWFRDKHFREQLRHDPDRALAGYNLTPEQRSRLLNLRKSAAQRRPEKTNSFTANTNQPFSLN